MSAVQFNAFGLWAEPARDAFNFWISFSPMAPLFGVEWRFSQDAAHLTDDAQKAAEKMADDAQKTAEKIVDVAEEFVEASLAEVEAVIDIAPAAEVDVATAPVAPEAAPADGRPAGLMSEAPADADDLTLLNGVGPALAKQLNALGVYTFAQLADFSDADLAWIDENLKGIKGRCYRDNWVGQAKARI